MIEGVKITPLKQILDERGKIMHMMRCDDAYFQQFCSRRFKTDHLCRLKLDQGLLLT